MLGKPLAATVFFNHIRVKPMAAPETTAQQMLNKAVQLLKGGGNHTVVRQLLEQVTIQEPHNESAWMWSVAVARSMDERHW